ncbi:UNVERIFIED_CONTAM: thioredoxin family protein [Halobacillus marinus]|uniref:thioredoxin family protein n=1 Tax=Bacillus sp. SB49 TaxID=1071080 RepID=UPI00041EC512|nr:thioredoxin family protein [Bacillus sp. SB49]QHT47496.1 thioredoxin family protein [Bacillus sp. SB49]
MRLEEWFNKGMTAQTYVDQMQTHQENFIYIYENFGIPVEDEPTFTRSRMNGLRAIVLTEDWCGDAMMNVPIFLRMAEAAQIPVHFLLRDENLDLMDNYLTDGRARSIPKIILMDKNGEEVANWGPRAPEVQQFIDTARQGLPDKEAEDFNEKQKEMLTFITKAYRDHHDFWNYVYEDLKKTFFSY